MAVQLSCTYVWVPTCSNAGLSLGMNACCASMLGSTGPQGYCAMAKACAARQSAAVASTNASCCSCCYCWSCAGFCNHQCTCSSRNIGGRHESKAATAAKAEGQQEAQAVVGWRGCWQVSPCTAQSLCADTPAVLAARTVLFAHMLQAVICAGTV